MSIFNSILTGLSHVSGAGTLGAVGAIATSYLNYKQSIVNNKHELDLMNARKELIVAEGQNAVNLEKEKQAALAYTSDKAAYGESFTGRIGDFFRAMQRPCLTDYFTLVSSMAIGYGLWKYPPSADVWADIAKSGIYTMLDLMVMCVSYWFVSRQYSKGRIK